MSDEQHSTPQHTHDETPHTAGVSLSEERINRRSRHSAPAGTTAFTTSRAAVIAIAAVAALVVLSVGADVAFSWDRIHPGVRLSGVAVGSLTREAAAKKLNAAFEAATVSPVVMSSGDARWKVTTETVGATIDATASVRSAMEVGRTQGVWRMLADRLRATFGGVDVTATVATDPDKVTKLLDKVDGAIGVPSKDASVSVVNGKAVFHPAEAGDSLDRDATTRALLAAFLSSSHSARAVIVAAPVQVSDAAAQQAYADAQKLLGGPVKVTYQGRSVTVPASTVARWVRFERRALAAAAGGSSVSTSTSSGSTAGRFVLAASFDATRVGTAIRDLTDGLVVKPRDATFVVVDGKVSVKASRTGKGADLAALASELASACLSGGPRTAELNLVSVEPSLTTQAARDMDISERISTYTTYYSASATARVNNIHLLADTFNAKLVPPGGTFSFNGTAGQRTAAKGYQEAPAIVNGKLVPQLGGGVCQVGTTFFNAVFFAGLPVVERHNHSFYISHYPKGRDATVSWGGPDFKFKNDTGSWILIRTSYTAGSLTIALYGKDPGYTVEYTTSKFLDVVPHKVTEIKDPSLKKGARVVQDSGIDGGRVIVVRTVYKGSDVIRTDTFVSRYTPVTEVVRVGTKVTSKPTTTTPTP